MIKVYHGYGHTENLMVDGHVLLGHSNRQRTYTNNVVTNALHLVRLFLIHPLPNVQVQLEWRKQRFSRTTESDGYFKFEWKSETNVDAGWHEIKVHLLSEQGESISSGEGKLYVPESTQYGFISDIDDTVLVSHSSTTGKKMAALFTKNPRSRQSFSDVVNYYRLLSLAHCAPNLINPFFYVSNSEWNLYDDLNEFFKHQSLPKGVFLLKKIKRWYQLLQTGKSQYADKLPRMVRILEAFPEQRFILLGDNTQHDPPMYVSIANAYPEKIVAIYIRNINKKKEVGTAQLLASIQNKRIHTCLFKHTEEAIAHSKSIGLIEETDAVKL